MLSSAHVQTDLGPFCEKGDDMALTPQTLIYLARFHFQSFSQLPFHQTVIFSSVQSRRIEEHLGEMETGVLWDRVAFWYFWCGGTCCEDERHAFNAAMLRDTPTDVFVLWIKV